MDVRLGGKGGLSIEGPHVNACVQGPEFRAMPLVIYDS